MTPPRAASDADLSRRSLLYRAAGAGIAGGALLSSLARPEAALASTAPTPLHVYDVTTYDTLGDGTGNDAPKIQAAIDDAATGASSEVVIPPGRYRCLSTLRLASDITLRFQAGATLDFSAHNATAIEAAGTEGGRVALGAAAARGSSAVRIAAGSESGFPPGSWIRVGSGTLYTEAEPTGSGMTQYVGELALVESTEAEQLNLRWPLYAGTYPKDDAWVAKVEMLENVSVIGRGTIIGGGSSAVGIRFDRVYGGRVADVIVENCHGGGVAFGDVVGGIIERVHGLPGTNENALSYGAQFAYACQDCTLVDSYFRDYRTGATCSGGTTDTRPGITRGISYINNRVVDSRSVGLGQHSGVEDIAVVGNLVYHTGHGEASGGIGVRSSRAVVVGNTIRGAAKWGIWARNNSTRPTQHVIADNKIEAGTGDGIFLSVELPTVDNAAKVEFGGVTVADNAIRQAGGHGIRVLGRGATSGRFKGVTITGNAIDAVDGYAIELDQVDGFAVTGNVGRGVASGLVAADVTDGAVTGNTFVARTPGSGSGVSMLTKSNEVAVTGNRVADFESGLADDSSVKDCSWTGNHCGGCTHRLQLTGSGHVITGTAPASFPLVASAAVITVPQDCRAVNVSGTADITAITPRELGTVVTLRFTSNAASTGVVHGPNLRLAGDFRYTIEDTLTLTCRGSVWHEIARSSNQSA